LSRTHQQQEGLSSSSHDRPLLPLQSEQQSTSSSSSELRPANNSSSRSSNSEDAPVLSEEHDEEDDGQTVDYGSDEVEEQNHWIAYADNCRFAPTVYPWWQSDTLLFGINSILENNPSSQQQSPRPQIYYHGLEFELHHSLAKWLHNQVYLTANEVLVYRADGKTITTGIERDLDE
jgi:hypothetical protein